MNLRRQEQYQSIIKVGLIAIESIISLRKTFIKLSANPKPADEIIEIKNLLDVYLSQDSIVNNFAQVFGY